MTNVTFQQCYIVLWYGFFCMHQVCTIKVAQAVASSINANLYLHVGSHLGAVVHGQLMPWDDDVDMIMDFRQYEPFLETCGGEDGVEVHPASGLRLKCTTGHNAVKVWLWQEGMEKLTRANVKWFSPFLDLFFYVVEDGKFWEVFPSGKKHQESYPLEEYFPTRPFSFGGETTRANYN